MQEEGLSLLAQSNRLQDYADRKGLEIIKTFEIVESSTHGERKQFMEMINFCKKQRETIAIVADTVDRVQRSFKESVLLDELMRKDKIELHFYREGMVLNSKSTSVDIMRWDFSVMGAKAYVMQLSENVRRSNEQKNKNGEITGQAPLGYENYIDERGKKFVRPKEPDATIIKKLFEMYSLGNTSVAELMHYANIMGLKSRKGIPVSTNTMYYMLDRLSDDINILLNYSYTILRAIVARAVAGNGLLPYIGIKHCNKTNPMPLVDDLIEPFRAIADKIVYDEVNKLVNIDHIELTPEIKRNITKIITYSVQTAKGSVSLNDAIYDFVASLVISYEMKKVVLRYPEI